MISEITYLTSGIVFGLSGGLTPGPLLTLVISETFKHGKKEGIKVAVAPLISDFPIVVTSLFILSKLENLHIVLAVIAITGAFFLLHLSFESFRFEGTKTDVQQTASRSLHKGVIANFLNPNPYLFWFTIGASTMLKAGRVSVLAGVYFIAGFYICLVGAKVLVALVAGKSSSLLKSRYYVYMIRFLGLLLLLFAFMFFKDGLRYMGVI